MSGIYLDHNATSRPLPSVVRAVTAALEGPCGNPGSAHEDGHRAARVVEDTRDAVASLLGNPAGRIVFTSGGTEANNLALKGIADARLADNRARHAVTTAIEHPSVDTVCRLLSKSGWEVTRVPPGPGGVVEADAVAGAIRTDTAFCSVMLANNETGHFQPVAEVSSRCRELSVPFHVDAVQATGRTPLEIDALGADLATVSFHKSHGPPGIGCLFVRDGVRIMARVHGGEQEGGLRAGTPDIPALAGLHAWTREVRKPAWAAALAKCATLRDRLEEGIVAALPGASVNGDRAGRLPNTTHLHLGAVPGRALVNALALEGIAASRGSACAAGDPRPSHVLRAMGMDASRVDGSIRFSLGIHTTEEDIDEVLRRIPGAVESARAYADIAQGQAAPPGDGSDECCGQPLFPA